MTGLHNDFRICIPYSRNPIFGCEYRAIYVTPMLLLSHLSERSGVLAEIPTPGPHFQKLVSRADEIVNEN